MGQDEDHTPHQNLSLTNTEHTNKVNQREERQDQSILTAR